MEELLQKLLEAEVLTEDTKNELKEAFDTKINEAVETAKAEAEADVRAELTEQWVNERDALIEAVDSKVGDFLDAEFEELKEDIERFRDLEAEYAEKLVEAKAQMSDELKNDLVELVEKLDAFLEIRLTAELDELREDIDEVRKNDFGRRIFEAVAQEYQATFADDESVEGTLRETEQRLEDTEQQLEEAVSQLSAIERKLKMEEVLSPLSGRQREVMEAILKNVETDQLEEGYKTFIGRVLRESDNAEADSEKEGAVLAESASDEETDNMSTTVLSGDRDDLFENVDTETGHLSSRTIEEIRRLAGIS